MAFLISWHQTKSIYEASEQTSRSLCLTCMRNRKWYDAVAGKTEGTQTKRKEVNDKPRDLEIREFSENCCSAFADMHVAPDIGSLWK